MLDIKELENKTRSQLEMQKQFISNVIDLSSLAMKLGKEYNVHPTDVMKLMLVILEKETQK